MWNIEQWQKQLYDDRGTLSDQHYDFYISYGVVLRRGYTYFRPVDQDYVVECTIVLHRNHIVASWERAIDAQPDWSRLILHLVSGVLLTW